MRTLPLNHPEYRYPGSRNPYWKKSEALPRLIVLDNETETKRGNWRSFLEMPESAPLVLEVGCNAGHVVTEWAARDSHTAYLGLDWKVKAAFRAAEKCQKKNLKNIAILRAHGKRLGFMFGDGELDRVHIFFSDPWPKKSQHKNRLMDRDFFIDAAKVLKVGGVLEIRTDHEGYFDVIETLLKELDALWSVRSITRDKHALNPERGRLEIPEITLFEKLFVKDGLPIFQIEVCRRPSS